MRIASLIQFSVITNLVQTVAQQMFELPGNANPNEIPPVRRLFFILPTFTDEHRR
jgi:hypothetical protein